MDVHGATLTNGDQDDQPEKRDSSAQSSPQYHVSDSRGSANSGNEQQEDAEDRDEEEDEDEDEDEEPRLKYIRLTGQLPTIYRGGDTTSTFVAAGDKLIIGTHNGNIHVLLLPLLQPLRLYHAHSATVTSISISPFPPPLAVSKLESRLLVEDQTIHVKSPSESVRSAPRSKTTPQPVLVTPLNSIYIATSSMDGNVCVSSLADPKDVLLRNFGRPVEAVALSPEYKSDRTYLSGGRAGQLVRTVGGRVGVSSNSTTISGAAATASSWLGTIGLGGNTGKDTVLHSGEGMISTIKWSLSGKYVTWVNEEGIKIMRTNLHLHSSDSEFAWTRISHIDRPNRPGWEEMASVWKARAEWVDESSLEAPGDIPFAPRSLDHPSSEAVKVGQNVEKLVVGWGSTVWVVNVYPDRLTTGKSGGGRKLGSAEVVTILRTDCIVSGVSLYSSELLLILAYIKAGGDEPEAHGDRQPGSHCRHKGAQPELRLVNINTKEEISADPLSIGRFEHLSSSDYHLSVLPLQASRPSIQRGALGLLGNGILDATLYPARLFSSSASVRSNASSGDKGSGKAPSSFAASGVSSGEGLSKELQVAAYADSVKIFIHSPYDCLLAVKWDLADRFSWLESRARYEEAWSLIDEHPEAASAFSERTESTFEPSAKPQGSLEEFFADDNVSVNTVGQTSYSIAEKEKRRIGELWIEQLVGKSEWERAGEVCGKVLDYTPRWEHWIWIFIKNNKFDEITSFIPVDIRPRISALAYEVILGHYVSRDRRKFKELLEIWPSDLFDISSITSAIEDQLKFENISPDSQEWQILMDSLAKLLLAEGRYREALRCYIRLQDAETAMSLMRDYRLLDAVSDNIPGFILLRVSKEQMKTATMSELKTVTAEPIQILVREAYNGIVRPETVVAQLQSANLHLYLYLYLSSLWRGESHPSEMDKSRLQGRGRHARDAQEKLAADEGKSLVEPFADTTVELFADYDRPLLMDFLQSSTTYSFTVACTVCEARNYTPELIYLLSKMGQTKRALNLILTELKDVSQAISFAKSQDDPELWEDLLSYSMDKPQFIHGLLAEAGTAIDPIKLVRRIPSGLEIEGLREGLARMIREHDIQTSISQGAAKVLQGEVAIGMETLRRGQRRGIKFDIIQDHGPLPKEGLSAETTDPEGHSPDDRAGRCGSCHQAFHIDEREILVGFACGHVFHLSHLHTQQLPVRSNEPPVDDDATDRPSSSSRPPTADEPTYSMSRTIGPKVITARLIRDRVGSGCAICTLGKEADREA